MTNLERTAKEVSASIRGRQQLREDLELQLLSMTFSRICEIVSVKEFTREEALKMLEEIYWNAKRVHQRIRKGWLS